MLAALKLKNQQNNLKPDKKKLWTLIHPSIDSSHVFKAGWKLQNLQKHFYARLSRF